MQNLVTKIGALSGIQKAVEQGKLNYQAIKENTIHKHSLRGMGVVRKEQPKQLDAITEGSQKESTFYADETVTYRSTESKLRNAELSQQVLQAY